MHHLKDILKPQAKNTEFTLGTLKQMNIERKSRQQKITKRSLVTNAAKDYVNIATNYLTNPRNCQLKLECMNRTLNSVPEFCHKIIC